MIQPKLLTIFSSAMVFVVVFLNASVVKMQEPPQTLQAKKERIEAERVWEQMVKAKGGREKLHAISNMMLSKSGTQTEFYVYPNRFWKWSKGKIVYDYFDVTMANLDAGVYLTAYEDGVVKSDGNLDSKVRSNYREGFLMDACLFLLETKWLKPTPVRVTRQMIDKEQFDVIETRFTTLDLYKGWGLDYFIDPETLKVSAIRYYSIPYGESGFWYFDNYVTVDGIQVPQRGIADITLKKIENWKRAKKSKCCSLSFQFNVPFDEKLFERPPSTKAGFDAWKPKQ